MFNALGIEQMINVSVDVAVETDGKHGSIRGTRRGRSEFTSIDENDGRNAGR